MKSIVAVPILCLSMVVPSVSWSALPPNFPTTAGFDNTVSLGQFKIRVTKEKGQELFGVNVNFCPGDPNNSAHDVCVLTSPPLADRNTKIGKSKRHKDSNDANSIDKQGAEIGCDVLDSSCPSNGILPNKVKDSDFGVPNPNPFEGSVGTNDIYEIHTQILYFHLTRDLESKGCNSSSESGIRAGNAAPDQPRSIGEIESKTTTPPDFPAESFFNIFVEIDLDLKPNTTPGGVIILYNEKPLVITNASLGGLPPRVVYTHENSSGFAPLVYDKSNYKPFGWVTLAGHATKYDCNEPGDLAEFTKIFENMKENTKLEPIKALSVNLDTFTANAADGKITINWTTGTETDNAGFTLWRATPIDGQCSLNPSNYKDVKKVQPLVYSKSQDGVLGANYSEQDQNVEAAVTYCYGLEDIEYNGKRKFHVDKIISATLN